MSGKSNATLQAVLTLYKRSLPSLEGTGDTIQFGFDTVTVKVYNNDLNAEKNLFVGVELKEIDFDYEAEEEDAIARSYGSHGWLCFLHLVLRSGLTFRLYTEEGLMSAGNSTMVGAQEIRRLDGQGHNKTAMVGLGPTNPKEVSQKSI